MDSFTFDDIRDQYTEEIRKNTTSKNQSNADTRINPSGCILNQKFVTRLEAVQNFVVYPDDTWVLSFPKCGTTWTQEMVWLLKNNMDYEKAKEVPIRMRFPFLELEAIVDTIVDPDVYPLTIDLAAAAPRPRCIKSHLPPQLLPKQIWTVKPKVVYVARNPKDAVVSYYHHHRLWNGYQGTFEDFFQAFVNDRVVYAPYWNHILSFWDLRDRENVLFNTYEEMKKDLAAVVKRTAKFLKVDLSEEEVIKLCDHLSFKSMKNNASVNYTDVSNEIKSDNKNREKGPVSDFMRAGETGGWRKVFTPEMTEQMDNWTKRYLEGTNFDDSILA